MEETEKFPPKELPFDDVDGPTEKHPLLPTSVETEDGEAQSDPRGLAPLVKRNNSDSNGIRTSLLFVLFEYCLKDGTLSLKFLDGLSTIWRLDKFANASFHSSFQISSSIWREKILEDEVLRNRLIKQHWNELQKLTYPMPKRAGVKPIRKRGYRDKGSNRPLHQKFRSDVDTTVAVYRADLQLVEKVVIFGRRPSVTYRRLPYSRKIGRLLELGLLVIEGDFIIPFIPEKV